MARTAIIALPTKSQRSGYTLAELLVVLAIVALISAVIAPRLINTNPTPSIGQSAGQLANLYKQGRQQALFSGISQKITIDTNSKTAWHETGDNKLVFAVNIEVQATTAESESAPGLAGIRFFPDGSSTGGEVHLMMDKSEYVIEVIWANGEIRVAQVQ